MTATTTVRTEPVGVAPAEARGSSATRLIASRLLLAVALVAVWALLYALVLSRFEYVRDQRSLYASLRTALAGGTAPVSQPIRTGEPVALIDIPAAGVHRQVVVEGTGSQQLKGGPGLSRASVLPGQDGVSVIMARGVTFGAPFAHLTRLDARDPITITTGQGTFAYRVARVVRAGGTPPAMTFTGAALVLVSAEPSLTPSGTVYAYATLEGTALPPTGVATARAGESPMAADHSALTLATLVLSLQLLVVALAGLVWLRQRWSSVGAWVAGVPAVLAALWLTTSIAARLIPNVT